jgi:hypothetical protein
MFASHVFPLLLAATLVSLCRMLSDLCTPVRQSNSVPQFTSRSAVSAFLLFAHVFVSDSGGGQTCPSVAKPAMHVAFLSCRLQQTKGGAWACCAYLYQCTLHGHGRVMRHMESAHIGWSWQAFSLVCSLLACVQDTCTRSTQLFAGPCGLHSECSVVLDSV